MAKNGGDSDDMNAVDTWLIMRRGIGKSHEAYKSLRESLHVRQMAKKELG